MVRNNPIRLAESEWEKIWPDSALPDIIVSLGTGIAVDPITGQPKEKGNRAVDIFKDFLPSGIRKQVEMAIDMARSAVNCQDAWDDYRRSLPNHSPLARNCHRLNVGLLERVGLDDVDKMQSLDDICKNYLSSNPNLPYFDKRYKSARRHIQAVAKRLLATLFYFTGDLRAREGDRDRDVTGSIYCRLPPGSRGWRSLMRLNIRFQLRELRRGSDTPKFTEVTMLPFDYAIEDDDLYANVSVRVSAGWNSPRIEVLLPGWRRAEPISGF